MNDKGKAGSGNMLPRIVFPCGIRIVRISVKHLAVDFIFPKIAIDTAPIALSLYKAGFQQITSQSSRNIQDRNLIE